MSDKWITLNMILIFLELYTYYKVIYTYYKELKYHLKEKRRGLQIPPPEVTIMNGLVHLSQALSLSCLFLSLSLTQADSLTSLFISPLCGLTDGIQAADGWSSCFPPKRILRSPLS